MVDLRVELSRFQVDAYREEFAELVDSWKALETKAQGTAAVAGIFFAAVFAFVRDLEGKADLLRGYGLIIATASLGLAVGAGLMALRIRKIPRPPLGADTQKLVNDLLALESSELGQRLPLFYNDLSGRWAKVNNDLADANDKKSTWLLVSQALLALAILIVGIVTVEFVISSLP